MTVSALAIENGPGPQRGASDSSGSSRYSATTISARCMNSLSSLRRQTMHVELPAWRERLAHVAKRRHRVGEEHRPEAGEGVVEGLVELRRLDVERLVADVRDPGVARLLDRRLDHPLGDVDPVRVAGRADQLRQPHRRVAEPAADVEHAVALAGGWRRSARSPCSRSAVATRSRYSIQISNSGPFQASVASTLSSTTRISSATSPSLRRGKLRRWDPATQNDRPRSRSCAPQCELPCRVARVSAYCRSEARKLGGGAS